MVATATEQTERAGSFVVDCLYGTGTGTVRTAHKVHRSREDTVRTVVSATTARYGAPPV